MRQVCSRWRRRPLESKGVVEEEYFVKRCHGRVEVVGGGKSSGRGKDEAEPRKGAGDNGLREFCEGVEARWASRMR
jgi:hypothetical protein